MNTRPNKTSRLAVLTVVLVATGCSSIDRFSISGRRGILANSPIRLTYRTDSARLTVSAEAANRGIPTATCGVSSVATLPPFSVCNLDIRYPHPDGRPDCALVTVVFDVESVQGTSSFGFPVLSPAGQTEIGAGAANTEFREQWAMDMPKSQLDRQIAHLKRSGFFRRVKILSPQAFVGVEMDGKRVGEQYLAVPELDTFLLHVRQQGRLVSRTRTPAGRAIPRTALGQDPTMRRLPPI